MKGLEITVSGEVKTLLWHLETHMSYRSGDNFKGHKNCRLRELEKDFKPLS